MNAHLDVRHRENDFVALPSISQEYMPLPALELLVYVRQERQTHKLPRSGRLFLGRGHHNDVRVEDRSISRQHLCVLLDGGIVIEDLGSSNGTFLYDAEDVSGEETEHKPSSRLEPNRPVRIRVGDTVRVGSVLLVFQPAKVEVDIAPTKAAGPPVLEDPEMKRVYELATRAAGADISVLILGETGVGKEVLAETIHRRSPRSRRPFLRLNCAALPETLLESELFGHERGAFTGAASAKPGLIESTDGGTVFLDEIGELPLSMQVKLLRVLEDRAVMRVGGTRTRQVDVRFITATHRDLEQEIRKGSFREDFYFRINGIRLVVPPLRQRKAEILPLARLFLAAFCARSRLAQPQISEEAMQQLLEYSWPGNVRELRNVMDRAPLLAGDGPILAEHVPRVNPLLEEDFGELTDVLSIPQLLSASRTATGGGADGDSSERINEKDRVIRALEACGGNQTRAAKMLGISRRTLVNRLDEFGLPRPRKRGQ
jgi:DNA-binding NtrC family response regulator